MGFTNALFQKKQHSEPEGADVQRSKLEIYEDVLTALADKPLSIDSIAYACNMDCIALRQHLNFLIKNDLVEERNYAKTTRYALTRRGMSIYKTLAITKSLKKLQKNMKKINEALKTIPSFSEYNTEKASGRKRNENY